MSERFERSHTDFVTIPHALDWLFVLRIEALLFIRNSCATVNEFGVAAEPVGQTDEFATHLIPANHTPPWRGNQDFFTT